MSLFEIEKRIPSNLLKDRFVVPPFSVFNTTAGYWQEHRRAWIDLGIKSDLGRVQSVDKKHDRNTPHTTWVRPGSMFDKVEAKKKYGRIAQEVSIFDPVLCEISYKWFTTDEAKILDPFAGGSVRGIVAGCLGRSYVGIDLNKSQLEANEEQSANFRGRFGDTFVSPHYINGNSENIERLVNDKFDFLFSCPPYYNLEVYSTDENDLSYKRSYEEFLVSYRHIIRESVNLLNDNSFAVFVVSNIRENNGRYYNLYADTVSAFENAGMIFYNEAIIVNSAGTLPLRQPKQFSATRKIGRMHQYYLCFYKGNWKNIKVTLGDYEQKEGAR